MRVRAQLGCAGLLTLFGLALMVAPEEAGCDCTFRPGGLGPALAGLTWLALLELRYLPAARQRVGDRVVFLFALIAGFGIGLIVFASLARVNGWWQAGMVLTAAALGVLGFVLATITPG
ncbi:hypothetical protein [Gandjariella thermophila]|uniref:Uncharacterized protein n=1 Tax=Gandjariella thermophila TaxID=1931992 RepID=A0A4D4J2F7_9PSEU|nr:hypothetical protein [Gandjariella thermophila]GDY30661.1 hypothetical protein GTS_22940 [Gandjariella thermophila]